ncbi:hypothetical protein PanWU01x14_171800 [Parasponia andersonii]|uniref:Uncharacterized protein n=1 Tax=Parasponia andersonii TaxID=3476 RepID=A0A2P5C998_PARAD|nr:hypothetical protein PanWU01x14_171800 [Parasponia andersonii]
MSSDALEPEIPTLVAVQVRPYQEPTQGDKTGATTLTSQERPHSDGVPTTNGLLDGTSMTMKSDTNSTAEARIVQKLDSQILGQIFQKEFGLHLMTDSPKQKTWK